MATKKPSGWEVPPDPFTGEGGYSTTDPSAAFKPGAKPIYPRGGSGGGGGGGGSGGGMSFPTTGGGGVEISPTGEVLKIIPPSGGGGLSPQQLSLSQSYRTRGGVISAQDYAEQGRQKALARQRGSYLYQQYKGIETKYLSDVQKKAYQKYLQAGMSEAQSRYLASQWRKAQESDIKASGGFTIYQQPITTETTLGMTEKKPERVYTFKDVLLFPKYKKDLPGLNKITLKSYLFYKGDILYKKAEDKIYSFIPENLGFSSRGFNLMNRGINVKKLFNYKVSASPTELVFDTAKFGFFYPAMLTTPQALTSAISRGDITPVVETGFKSVVTPKGEFYDVKTMSISKTGGLKVGGVSRQIIKDYGDDISFGLGTGVSGSRVGYTNKVNYNVYDIIGVNKALGKSRLISPIDSFAQEVKQIGTGVKSFSVSDDILRITQRRGLGGITTYKNIYPNLNAEFNLGNVKIMRQFDKTKVIGVINKLNVDEEIYGFVGTTNKPIIKIKSSGRAYKIYPDEINVEGIIKYGIPNKPIYFGEETRQGFLSDVIQTPILSEQLKTGTAFKINMASQTLKTSVASQTLNSVTKNINVLNTALSKDIGKVISGFTSKPATQSIVTISKTKKTDLIIQEKPSRFADMTGSSRYADYTGNRFSDLGVLNSGFNSNMKMFIKSQQKPNQRLRGGQKNIFDTGEATKQKQLLNLNLKQPQRQGEKLKTALKLVQKLKYPTRPGFRTPGLIFKIPKTEYSKFPKLLKGKIISKQSFGKFPVYARRFSKWKVVGFGRTPQEALFKGQQFSKKTLGRSFYVPGVKQPSNIFGFRTKKEKVGQIYIQKTGKGAISTLGSSGEKAEIKFFRGLKMKMPKIKKKRKGRFDLW